MWSSLAHLAHLVALDLILDGILVYEPLQPILAWFLACQLQSIHPGCLLFWCTVVEILLLGVSQLGEPVTLGSMGIIVPKSGHYNCLAISSAQCIYVLVYSVSIPKPLCVQSSVWPGRRHRETGRQLVQSSPSNCITFFSPQMKVPSGRRELCWFLV